MRHINLAINVIVFIYRNDWQQIVSEHERCNFDNVLINYLIQVQNELHVHQCERKTLHQKHVRYYVVTVCNSIN